MKLMVLGVRAILLPVLLGCSQIEDKVEVVEKSTDPDVNNAVMRVDNNSLNLITDITAAIDDSSIVFNVPNLISYPEFVVGVDYNGETLIYEDSLYGNHSSIKMNFENHRILRVTGKSGIEKNYNLCLNYFTHLPVCRIETEDKKPIISKNDYVTGIFSIWYNGATRIFHNINNVKVQVKGRGNSTWTEYPKKPFRLKFENKQTLFGEASDKSWVLLANYYDKTMLANHIAFTMGRDSKLDYTPCDHFCELILNGVYQGTYQLSEKIKIDKNRVNVGKDGYLLEIDGYARQEADARYFSTKNLTQVVNIKDPDVEYGDESFTWVKDYIIEADSVLYSDNFLDPENGWRKYYDFESCVDYYLINEIVKNTDFVWWMPGCI